MPRPRVQQGQVMVDGPHWVLRHYTDRSGKRIRVKTPLGSYAAHPFRSPDQAREFFRDKIADILGQLNSVNPSVRAGFNIGEFIEHSYFPHLESRIAIPAENELHIEPSTVKSYRDIYNKHIKNNPVAKAKVRDFDTPQGERFMKSVDQNLSHVTHLRIKAFMRSMFSWATTDGVYTKINPMIPGLKVGGLKKVDVAKLPGLTDAERLRKQKIQDSNNHAYTLEEIAEMMEKLPEPARTVCAVAAFTGLTRSELPGLKWEDYYEEHLHVQRKVLNGVTGPTKTEARQEGVYVMPLLQKVLAKYKKKFPPMSDGWIFRGEKFLNPLNLDNLSRRVIPQRIDGAWFGWHAFRRGLGTRLKDAKVPDKDIQGILRHADISTTQAYYIKTNPEEAKAGLKKLGIVAQKKYGIKA